LSMRRISAHDNAPRSPPMIVTEARILANRRNALLSTGPRTQEGKDRSRANALKHGLCSAVLVPESVELIQQRASDWYYALKPQNPHQSWLVDQVAVVSLRIDRSVRMERRLRDRNMLRAELAWDDDRSEEVEVLGSTISRRPSEVAKKLRKTPKGCDWLMTRWAMLARSADNNGSWTPEQTRLAFDLLGTPLETREGHQPGDLIDLEGKVLEAAEGAPAVARREVAALKERREVVAELDEVDRCLTAADLFDESNAALKRLRRYEGALHNRLRWNMKQIQYRSPHARTNPEFKPKWVEHPDPIGRETSPAEAPIVSRAIDLPFDLTPDEFPAPGEEVDLPKIIASRLEKKVRKAEARREAKRRKVERLRE
jgi:hypothetical protein